MMDGTNRLVDPDTSGIRRRHAMETLAVRPVQPEDIDRLHTINEAAVPGVNALAPAEFAGVIAKAATVLVATARNDPVGFVVCMREGLRYESVNYGWLSDRYDRFVYVDRVAVDESARGRSVGGLLYAAVTERFATLVPRVLAEVNLAPPNPGSIRFHQRQGFRPIGERWTDDRARGVVYMMRPLRGA